MAGRLGALHNARAPGQPAKQQRRGWRGARSGPRCCAGDALLRNLANRAQQLNQRGPLPKLGQDHSQVVQRQLQALQENNEPWTDHGIELLYRHSAIDPWERSRYFGRSLDLGQFERFRRVFHTSPYAILNCHREATVLASLQVSERRWKERVRVRGARPGEAAAFTFSMLQREGGCFDGIWFCESLICDDV